jgi:hypothetical protein
MKRIIAFPNCCHPDFREPHSLCSSGIGMLESGAAVAFMILAISADLWVKHE